MNPWGENTQENLTDESTFGESPFGELYEQPSESEWDSPFNATEAEEENPFGQEHEYETFAPGDTGLESPFTTTGYASDSEIMRGPTDFRGKCGEDVTFDGKKWEHGKNRINLKNPGQASDLKFVPSAEVYEFQLATFDVDRHELKDKHKERIAEFTKRVIAGIRSNKYSGQPIHIYSYGEASSTAGGLHNLPLSRNRAFNVLHAIRCELTNAGVSYPILYGLYGTGEQQARVSGPDNKEDPQFRGVIVRAFAPIKEKVCDCPKPPVVPPVGTTAICVSVPRIAPRSANKLPPDVIPLGSIVPGLRLPMAIVTKAQATVRVDDRRSRQSGQYNFTGWGLEVALPAGRARVDLQAELRAPIEVLVRASAHLGARLQLGPLKLSLRVDLSVFAQLIVKLCAQLRLRLDVDLGRPNVPELRQCRFLDARNVRGPFPFAALNGPAVLIVPGAGYGPAVLTLGGPAVGGLALASNAIQVPADKSSIRTLLALGGSLQLAQGGTRREAEAFDSEWPEAFEEVQSELAPFG